jgi:hypothetical protein
MEFGCLESQFSAINIVTDRSDTRGVCASSADYGQLRLTVSYRLAADCNAKLPTESSKIAISVWLVLIGLLSILLLR